MYCKSTGVFNTSEVHINPGIITLTVGSNNRRMTSRRDVHTSAVTVLLLEKLHDSRTQCRRNVVCVCVCVCVCTMWEAN